MLNCIPKQINFMIYKLYINKAVKIKKLSRSDRKEIRTANLEMKKCSYVNSKT